MVLLAIGLPALEQHLHVISLSILDPSFDFTHLRFTAKLKELRQKDPNLMLVFGGDLFGPSVTSGLTKGKHMVDVLNEIKVDYGCFGNHEYDFGLKKLNVVLYDDEGKAS